jgi:hypothetical protein
LATFVAVIAAACGGGASQDDFDDLRAQVAAFQTRVQGAEDAAERALLLSALPALEVAKFHEIDETINNDATIHATTPGIVQRALDVVRTTTWPAELADNVAQWDDALVDLLDPVLDDDAEAAGRPATIVHAISHAFEGAVSAFIAGDEIPAPPDLGTEHDHEAEEDEDHADEEDHDDE